MAQWLWIVLILGGSMLLLCVGVLLRKDGRFRSEHISQSKAMRERGIHCATSQDREARKQADKKLDINSL